MVVGQVSVTGTNPILAFSGPGAICVERITVTGSTFRWNLRAQSNRALGVQWWVFDTAAAAIKDASMADIEAAFYDQYGVKTFDAAASVMRIVDGIATPKTSPVVPFGGANLTDTTNYSVPAGKVYAIVQSTPAFVFTTYDTGSYGTGQHPPELNIGDGEPPLGMTWRYQNLESYQATGGYIDASTIRVGLTRFEFWPGWNSRDSTPFIQVEGQARHLIVDMTNFLAAGVPNPSVVVGSVTATSRSVTTGGAAVIAQSTTPSVTCSASGGSAPYSFDWQYVRGSNAVGANGSTANASFSTSTLNQDHNTTREAVWRCRITDQNGVVGYSPEVTFTHIASNYAVDVVPDPVSFGPITINSNDPDVAWIGTAQTITGITQAITLRVERYSYSGNLDAAMVDVVVRDAGGAVQFSSYFDARGTGLAYLDVTVQPGWSVGYYAHAITNSGRKSASWQMVVWNLSNPGGSVQISSQPVSAVVDADDNYGNADYTPNPISLSNQEMVTDEWEGYTAGTFFQITGINQPITIRISRGTSTDFGWPSGGTRRMVIGQSTNGGSSYAETNMGALSAPLDFTANNGDWFFLKGYFNTVAGRGGSSWTTTVANATTGVTLGSALIKGTVDNDNNYNVAPVDDFTMDAVSLPGVGLNTNDPSGYTNVQMFQVTGINRAVNLRFTRSGVGTGMTMVGNIIYSRQYIGHTTDGGATWATHLLMAAAGAEVNFTVNNGDYVSYYGYVETSSGRASASWYSEISNTTAGQYLGYFDASGTVDADDNFNKPSVSGSISGYVQQEPVGQNRRDRGVFTLNVTGGTPTSYQWLYSGWSGQITATNTTTKTATFTGPSYNTFEFTEIDSGEVWCNYVVNGVSYSASVYAEFNVRGGV